MALTGNMIAVIIVAIAWFFSCLFRCPVESIKMHLPKPKEFKETPLLTGAEQLGVGDLIGPEDIVRSTYKPNVMFAGLGDGRIVRITVGGKQPKWETVVRTGEDNPSCGTGGVGDSNSMEALCGRPMGIAPVNHSLVVKDAPDEECLVVADAYKGLLLITGVHEENLSTETEVKVLTTRAKDDPKDYTFMFLNGVMVNSNGQIYMTETSRDFQRRRMAFTALAGHRDGRLLSFRHMHDKDIKSWEGNHAYLVQRQIFMPNGMAKSFTNNDIFIASGPQIVRYDSYGHRLSHHQFSRALPGVAESIHAMDHTPRGEKKNCFWVTLSSKYAPGDRWRSLHKAAWVRWAIAALVPYSWIISSRGRWGGLAVLDEDGKVMETFSDPSGEIPWITSALEHDGYMYLGSWYNNFLARVPMSQFKK